MFSGLLKITLAFTALILIAVNVSGMEINKDTYDIYLGDVDDDGDKDFYFAQKPWVLILHGDISTPLVMPPTKSFIVYNNFGTYTAPQSFTMSAATLASKISSGKLRLAVFNSDYFILSSTANNYTLLLRGADEYTPGLLIKSYSNVDFPTAQDVTTLSINSYDGISNRNIQLVVKDINRDGLNDIFLTKSDGSEYAYVTDNNSIPARFFEVTPSSIASIDKTRSLPAEFDVTSGGQATYKIPVITAPGSAGLVPNVSLNYSSGGGNGLMGLGWSLSAYGAISRCRQTEGVDGVAKAITWTSEDRFCLNGDRLLLASGTYGAAGSTYKTEIDSFARITAVGGTTGHPDSFTVEYKDGTIETYGNTTDSANSKNQLSSSNSNTVLDWALSKRSDSAGNKIIYTYTKDSDGQRINSIDFAYGSTTTRNAYLQFNYDSRNDPISGYVAGHAYKTGKRLSSVRSYNGSTEIRSYIITYNQGTAATTNDKLSRVNKVQECVGTVCAPATEFEWELPDYQLAATTSTKTFPSGISVHAMGDFNGDGLQDIVWFDQAVGGTYENAGLLLKRPLRYAYGKIDTNGNFSFENQNFTNNTDMGPRLNSRSIKVQDVNNDGRMDIVVDNEYKPSHSQFYKNYEVYLSLPMPDGTWRLSDTKSTTHTIPYQVLDQPLAVIEPDINGDGISDIIAWPIGDLPWDSETFGQYPAPYISLKNFSGGYTSKNLNHILGNPSLTAGITYEYLPDANFTNNMHTAPILRPISMYGDFNGDGAVDVVADVWQSYSGCGIRDDDGNRWCDSRGDGTVIYTMRRLSSGDYELHYHSSSVGLLYDGWDFAVDLNNDGLADIVSRHLTAGWGISINTGADLTTLQYSGVPKNPLNIFVPQGNHDSAIADINGDGYQDFVWQKPLNAASLIGSSEIKVKYWDPATNQFEAQERTLGSLPYKVIVNYNSATPSPDPRQSNVPRFKTDRFNMTDVNGDGVSDLITLPNTQTNDSVVTVRLGVNTKKNTNKIVNITSGLGDEKKIQYGRVNGSQHYSRIAGIKASGGLEQVCEDTVYNEGGIHEYTQQNCWNILTGSVDATAFYQEISNPWHSLRPEEQSLRPASPVLEAFGPMSVVTDVETTAPGASSSSPNNISNSTAKLSYFYGHAKMQAGGRGFLGFKYFTVVNRETGVRTETEYRQDWPYIGQARTIKTFSPDTADPKKSYNLSEQVNTWGLVNCHDTSGTPNSMCVANLSTQVDNSGTGALGAVKPFLRTSITKTYALKDNGRSQGDEISTSTEGNIYDSNGNVARTDSIVSSGSALGLPTLSKTTVNTYNYSGSTWSMQQGRLQSMTVSANEPTYGTITRTSDFTYYTSGAAIGLLNTETVEPNNSAFTVTTTHYYDKGNRYKSVTTADGQTRQSEVAYDNLGRYVDSTYGFFTNGTAPDTPIRQLVSQVVSRDKYGTPTEMRSYVSSSNYVTKKVFTKAFGTPYRTEDSTGAFAEIKTGSGIDAYSVCPSDNKIWQTTEAAGGALGIECRDVLGRVRRTGSLGFDGSDWSLVDTEYDKLSRVLRTSKPYWKKSSERYWTSQTYDLLGRVTETRAPYKNTYATTTTAYTNLEVRITNPKNQVRIEKRDLAGQVYEVIDPNNGTTAFAYDARGNMRVMRDPAANTTTVAYDLRDRKTSMSDPDKGNWTYKYNRFGDLVCQLDGKGQTSVQRYDIAGRMFSRTDRLAGGDCNNPTGTIDKYSQWNYDTAANGLGQLASVYDSLTTAGATQYQQTYSYDNLGRVSGTTTTMPGHAGAVGSHYESVTYDQYGRVDKTYDAARTSASFTTNGIQNLYNAQGYLYKVVDATAANQASYYTINQMNASGAVTNALYGNGVTQAADYYPQTGLTKTLRADRSLASLPIQDIELDWDEVGNLAWRHETGTASDSVRRNIRESFGYDSLNRLNTWTSSGDLAASETANYNNVDNITDKTGIGNYLYGGQCGAGTNAGPHALCRAGSPIITMTVTAIC
ncbi:MAG TPA: FG-GAP-like repeat-containing protein [Cellvibrio sp.]|nr:FG-GAP-like repeat-containing protein [Cellvibrio sp.]